MSAFLEYVCYNCLEKKGDGLMKEKLIELLTSQLNKMAIDNQEITIEIPKNKENGDFSTNIAMKLLVLVLLIFMLKMTTYLITLKKFLNKINYMALVILVITKRLILSL